MKVHELKTWPEFFDEIVDGRMTCNLRKNDRDFMVGDLLVLREWEPKSYKEKFGIYAGEDGNGPIGYSGEWVSCEVTHILRPAEIDAKPENTHILHPDYVILSFKKLARP